MGRPRRFPPDRQQTLPAIGRAVSKCPVKESEIYEKYATEHPQSPAAAEALYDAAWRWSALIEIYKTEEEPKKSEEARAKAVALAQRASVANLVRGLGHARPAPALPDGTRVSPLTATVTQ